MQIRYHYLSLLTILGIVFFFSCKEEDNTSVNKNNLLGTWVMTVDAFTACNSDEDNYLNQSPCTSENCTRYTFETDSLTQQYIIARTEGGITINEVGIFSVSDDKLTLCIEEDEEEICQSFKMNVSSNSLTLYNNNPETGCKEEMLFDREE